MPGNAPHRKRVKLYHEPGDLHELTFSCYRRMPLLTNDAWRDHLARSIDDSLATHEFQLLAFVFMPEHVHLLVYPTRRDATAENVSRFLADLEVGCSKQVKADLETAGSPLLSRLTIRERPGRTVFRFWQEGPGYDRNLQTERAVLASIDYIHLNPVRRRLVEIAASWFWSSVRWYFPTKSSSTRCCRRSTVRRRGCSARVRSLVATKHSDGKCKIPQSSDRHRDRRLV